MKHDLRLSDLVFQDYVAVLWLIIGGEYLRSHDGKLYSYDPVMGAWSLFQGIRPPFVYDYLRKFTMVTEGLVRDLVHPVTRTEPSLIDAIVHARAQYPELPAALSAWRLNAVNYKGNSHLTQPAVAAVPQPHMPPAAAAATQQGGLGADAGGGIGDGAGEGVEQPDEEVDKNRHIMVAQTISKIGAKLQHELLQGRVSKLAAEFCDSTKPAAKGIAFQDSLLFFNEKRFGAAFVKIREAEQDVCVSLKINVLTGVDPQLNLVISKVDNLSPDILGYPQSLRVWSGTPGFGEAWAQCGLRHVVSRPRRSRSVPVNIAPTRDVWA